VQVQATRRTELKLKESGTSTGRIWATMVALTLLVLASGCGLARTPSAEVAGNPTPTLALDATQAALAPAGPTLGGQRAGDDMLVWLASKPTQPVRGTAEMDAYLVGTDGQPVRDAKVTFDTDMTNMRHGPNQVVAVPAGDGHYRGQVRFLMPGPWRVITVIERPGRETVKSRFEFKVNFQ